MPPFTKSEFIWKNGEMVAWDDAQTHISAHGLQYGTGVFEGMRSYDSVMGPAIFRLEPHMRRLQESARFYELEIPYTLEQLCAAALDVVRVNRLKASYLRPLVYFDAGTWAVSPENSPVTTVIMAVPGKAYIEGGTAKGVRVSVSTIKRPDPSVFPATVKACGHYTNSVRAVQEAMRRGFDEAILMNHKGEIAEGSGENLFVVQNGTVITNDKSASILMGITRDSVLTLAKDLGLPVEIRPLQHADVLYADELFFTGTAVEVTPIREVDGRVIGDGSPGPITSQLQKTFYDAVHGRLPQYKSWLSPIEAD